MNYIALLRGAPITVFLAILSVGGQTTIERLVRITGYSKPTVIAAAQKLCGAGIATNNVMGLTLIGVGLQMVLGESYSIIAEVWDKRENSLPDVVGLKSIVNKESLKDTTLTGKKNLLAKAGISEPMRSRLAELPHCTKEYLVAHVKEWRKNSHLGIGILINRLRGADPAPLSKEEKRRKYTEGEFSEFIEH